METTNLSPGFNLTYRKEIFDFLRTVTIKFEPFAYLMGQQYMNLYGIDDPNGEWNPYYINLSGEYSENDTRMTVYSIEEERHVPFDKDTHLMYPKTSSIYKLPNKEYLTLEERYPENIGLIRTIAYPVRLNIKEIIAAPNLSLLSYDATLLHVNERESIIATLTEFLSMVKSRWWIPEYAYEDMYPLTFWAMMWQHLPNLLLAQRMKNLRTPYVHPFHIWEYLKSRNLNDYRDALTDKQSLWLYRNIDYIQKNKGKHNNLIILAENLLDEVAVSLLYKNMHQETDSAWDVPRFNPKFKSYNIITGVEEKEESFEQLNERLVDLELEHQSGPNFVLEQETKLGTQNHNILATKFLEFKKEPINTRNERLMVKFFLDTLMNYLVNNKLVFEILLTDPTTNIKHKLFINDAIALWYYAVMRSVEETPILLPTRYKSDIAFKHEMPNESTIERSIFYNTHEFDIKTLIDLPTMMGMIKWESKAFSSHDDFMSYLTQQFITVLKFHRELENSNKETYHLGMMSFYRDVHINKWLDVKLDGTATTYDEWLAKNANAQTILVNFEKAQPEIWGKLAENCFDAIFPLTIETSAQFVGPVRNLEKIYTSIRDLFIQLGSYNITYLETERDEKEYLEMYDLNFDTVTQTTRYDKLWVLVIFNLLFNGKLTHHLDIADVNVDFSISQSLNKNNQSDKLFVDFNIQETKIWKTTHSIKKFEDTITLSQHNALKTTITNPDFIVKKQGD